MATKLTKIIADFQTALSAKVVATDTTATLQSATDDDGTTLPSGKYSFTIDGDNTKKEYFVCDLVGTALTNVVNVDRQGVQTAGFVREHRVGATVKITNFTALKYIKDLVVGDTGFDATAPLFYDGDPTITADAEIATKKYVDDVAIAGAPDASTATKGITKLSSTPVSATNPIAVGDNDPRVPTTDEKAALAGTSGTPSSTNEYVTDDDTAVTATADKVVRADGSNKIDEDYLPDDAISPELTAYEDLTAGNLTKILNDGGTGKLAELYGLGQEDSEAIGITFTHATFTRLNDTQIVMTYGRSGDTNAYARIITIAEDKTITLGSTSGVTPSSQINCMTRTCRINDSKFAMVSIQNGGTADAFIYIASVSGTTITFGGSQSICGNTSNSKVALGIALLETDKVYTSVSYGGTTARKIVTITGTSSAVTACSTGGGLVWRYGHLEIKRIEDNKIAFLGKDGSNALRLQIGTISGTTLTGGIIVSVSGGSPAATNYELAVIDDGGLAITYGHDTAGNKTVYLETYSFSGTTLTLVDEYTYTDTQDINSCGLAYNGNDKLYMRSYFDTTGAFLSLFQVDSDYNLSLLFKEAWGGNGFPNSLYSGLFVNYAKDRMFLGHNTYGSIIYFNIGCLDSIDLIGISKEIVTTGNTTRPNIVGQVNSDQTGLTVGAKQYASPETGKLTASAIFDFDGEDWDITNYKAGIALSATEILLQ